MRGRAARAASCLLVGSLWLTQAGCGYRFVRPSQGVGGAHTIAIDAFRNETIEPGLDTMVTDALRQEFARRGSLRLVDDDRSADVVLSGQVATMSVVSRSFSSVQFALEYEVRLTLRAKVERRGGEPVRLDPRVLTASDRYLSSADVEVSRTYRREALQRVASLLAGRIADALLASAAP